MGVMASFSLDQNGTPDMQDFASFSSEYSSGGHLRAIHVFGTRAHCASWRLFGMKKKGRGPIGGVPHVGLLSVSILSTSPEDI